MFPTYEIERMVPIYANFVDNKSFMLDLFSLQNNYEPEELALMNEKYEVVEGVTFGKNDVEIYCNLNIENIQPGTYIYSVVGRGKYISCVPLAICKTSEFNLDVIELSSTANFDFRPVGDIAFLNCVDFITWDEKLITLKTTFNYKEKNGNEEHEFDLYVSGYDVLSMTPDQFKSYFNKTKSTIYKNDEHYSSGDITSNYLAPNDYNYTVNIEIITEGSRTIIATMTPKINHNYGG